ncbi:hypothetical protein [Streptomyces sp. NBC_01198]|uniref:hypothetical protein n=1 Tax=Streptomyces sp. NBC_01198 TaxID=2903769 RepID=UPI002E14E426|nr:hypothetical protein OG702_01270 [Streptomyces sp. NBC_01198]
MSRRTVTLQIAAAVTAVAAVAAVGAGSADAADRSTYRAQHGGPGKQSSGDHCSFTVDGKPWTAGQGLSSITPTADGKISIGVKGSGGACTVSLAAYLAHGADFASSGQQVLTDFATVSLAKREHGTLTITAPIAGCFAQIDLYKGSTEYDGGTGAGHGPAPKGPDGAVIGGNLLASWNGPVGGKDCVDQPTTPPAGPSTSATTSTSASPSTTAGTPAPSDSSSPATSSPATTSPAAVDATGSASASPTATGDQSLASTGGGSNTGLLLGLAAALVAAGGGVTYALRRRGAGRAH